MNAEYYFIGITLPLFMVLEMVNFLFGILQKNKTKVFSHLL